MLSDELAGRALGTVRGSAPSIAFSYPYKDLGTAVEKPAVSSPTYSSVLVHKITPGKHPAFNVKLHTTRTVAAVVCSAMTIATGT